MSQKQKTKKWKYKHLGFLSVWSIYLVCPRWHAKPGIRCHTVSEIKAGQWLCYTLIISKKDQSLNHADSVHGLGRAQSNQWFYPDGG